MFNQLVIDIADITTDADLLNEIKIDSNGSIIKEDFIMVLRLGLGLSFLQNSTSENAYKKGFNDGVRVRK